MQERLEITIAEAPRARAKVWKNRKVLWPDLVKRLARSRQTDETLKQFLAMNKEDQGHIKDVGGYVGGYLKNGKRSPSSVVHRQLLTLDIDFASTDFWEDFTLNYCETAVLHGTHKHHEAEPRFRLVMPLSRECTAEEYAALSRQVAGNLGIEMFDSTTFEVNRLMFWPSHPRDVEYYFQYQEGEPLNVDAVLDTYIDWRDVSTWPTADKKLRELGEAVAKQQNPFEKKGVVGAFCRTYGIREAIETFLPEEYVEGTDGRYTYTKGSTSSGLVIYEDTFAYSHHGTDPTSGKLCNAFDLVRIHLFDHLDNDEKGRKSFDAMEELARKDEGVALTLSKEMVEEAKHKFHDDYDEFEEFELEFSADDIEWMKGLKRDAKGEPLGSASNLNLIFAKDKYLSKAFRFNEFDKKRYVFKPVPWKAWTEPRAMENVDYSGIRNYIECIYGISSQFKIEDCLALEAEKNRYHPIKEMLNGLEWDGVKRIESLFIEYFGAEATNYTKQVARKMMAGAVARIMNPGCKFDYAVVLVDPTQGTFKSSFFATLGGEWFSDTLTTISGTVAFEQIQGAWIIEISELSALKKAEVESVKTFISKQKDHYRPAYGRTPETYKRQCIFVGTTNNTDFLKDTTGNRRFWPIDVRRQYVEKEITTDLPGELDQLWAEAMHLYTNGEPLFLDKETESLAREQQTKHSERDDRIGLLERYLDRLLPDNWNSLDSWDRHNHICNDDEEHPGHIRRKYVCTSEIWCECFGKRQEDITPYATKEINGMLRSLQGWKPSISTRTFKPYGTQRYYERIED